jgi:acyl carrier protein
MSLAKSPQPGATITKTLPTSEDKAGGRDLGADVRVFILKSFPLARKQQIKNSDALLESGLIDSQGVLEVVAFIEREFSTIVDDEELSPENFQTIDRIAAFIRSKTAPPNPGSGMR